MVFGKLATANREENPEAYEKYRSALIQERIRRKVPLEEELAVLRQKDTKPQKYRALCDFIDACIKEVDAELAKGN